MSLVISNLFAGVASKPILHGVNLTVKPGEVHAVMGPNGSGKSTLAQVLMGHPGYAVTSGKILLDRVRLNDLPPEARARAGVFLGFQYPLEVPGVPLLALLKSARTSLNKSALSVGKFRELVQTHAKSLHFNQEILKRGLNEDFSGGEKKKAELLQMLVLEPKYVILDECDSGLDIDALRSVAEGIERFRSKRVGLVLITHYQRILNFVKPDRVHVMIGGKIAVSGDHILAQTLEKRGYRWVKSAVIRRQSPVISRSRRAGG